ncbi:calcium/sodium antiporter [Candidatus Woesearchaeota archaeon]|nr:calcium/sodium antiporter [Candidatus Woesearchaeota archaeon]
MISETLLLMVGLVAVWIGADLVVEAAKQVARALNISEAFIGLTVLSIGTSLPEIFTHIMASIEINKGVDHAISGIAVGTNVGSNIIQMTLIVGIVGLVAKVYSDGKILKFDFPVMLGGIMLLFVFAGGGYISKVEGVVLALAYVLYLAYLGHDEKIHQKNPFKVDYVKDAFFFTVGMVLLLAGAHWAVDSARTISQMMGWSGSFVGTMILGVGTALPELTTALTGVRKGSHSISLGVLVGSNITNPLLALGIGAMISGYLVEQSLMVFDIPFWFFISLFALLFFWKDQRLQRGEAMILIGMYAVYMAVRIMFYM